MAIKSMAGSSPQLLARVRSLLPKSTDALAAGEHVVSAEAAASAAELLNKCKAEHMDVVNLTAMYLFRIVAEARWLVFKSPTKSGTILAFSSADALAQFDLPLPIADFEWMTGYEMGAAFLDDADNITSVAFDARSIDDLVPTVPPEKLVVFLHWADTIYFERFLDQLDPTLPSGSVDLSDKDYDPRAVWERTFIVGAVNVEGAQTPEDIALLTDSGDRIVVAVAPDHVAEFVAHGRVTPVSLTGEELLNVMEQQKTDLAFTVGGDLGASGEGPRHRSIAWTNAQALRILEICRVQSDEAEEAEAKRAEQEIDDDDDGGDKILPPPPQQKKQPVKK